MKALSVIGKRALIPLLILISGSVHAASFSVEERAGDIFIRDSNSGSTARVTNSGQDRSPSLSHDERQVVFVRDILGDPDYNDATRIGLPVRVMQLLVAKTTGRAVPLLLLDSPTEILGGYFSAFYSPQFSADGKYVYFLIQFGASSRAVCRISVNGGQPRYFIDALDFAIIFAGKYRGDLIVEQHRHNIGPGYDDSFRLISGDAREIGFIGRSQEDVYSFLNVYVGDVSGCEQWGKWNWMACVSRVR